jgi:hypothetical protein
VVLNWLFPYPIQRQVYEAAPEDYAQITALLQEMQECGQPPQVCQISPLPISRDRFKFQSNLVLGFIKNP